MHLVSSIVLRIVLILAGIAIMYTGINIGFGGILTLGLQGANDFVTVVNKQRFLAQDSHIRFLGGIWFLFGIVFIISAIKPLVFQPVLKFVLIAIFFGGLMRFTQMDLNVTLGPDIIGSLIAELIGMPVLYIWLSSVTKKMKSLRTPSV